MTNSQQVSEFAMGNMTWYVLSVLAQRVTDILIMCHVFGDSQVPLCGAANEQYPCKQTDWL